MFSIKTVTAICLGVTFCTAQPINISGVVQDGDGIGIVGATITLEKANVSTTSEAGGRFTLTGELAVKPAVETRAMARNSVEFRNGKIAFCLAGNTTVTISVFDLDGRSVFSSKQTLGSGAHVISIQEHATGIFLCKATIGAESYSFKAPSFGTSSREQRVVPGKASALTKQAKPAAGIDDVIAATSTGMLNYRCVMKNSDTSGVVIEMLPNAGDVTDADGNVYQSVRIGNQTWTAENLKTTKYNDGTPIAGPIFTNTQWSWLPTGACCYYNNDSLANAGKYGALYNWYAVNTGKLAPAGWRVPTDAEWDTLQNHLIANQYNWDGTTSGNKIAKSMAAQTDWASCNTAGTIGNDLSKNNADGFSALPGGYRYRDGHFNYQGYYGYWWSASEYDASNAYNRNLSYSDENLYWNYFHKSLGFSVRLLRDSD